MIDNPYSRYQSYLESPDPRALRKLRKDFAECHETLDFMFDVIQTLKPAVTIKFGEFLESVEDIRVSLNKLITHHKNKKEVMKLIHDAGSYESYVKKLHTPRW